MSEDETLTIREVAVLLKIGETTSDTMAQVGQLPGLKVQGSGVSGAPASTDGPPDRSVEERGASRKEDPGE